MPPEDVDIRDLERRVTQLEKAVERISERATRREEDWGTVRTRAEKVDGLRDEVRELRRLLGHPERTAVEPQPALPQTVAPVKAVSTESIVSAVMEQLKGRTIPTSKADATALLRQAIVDDQTVRQALVAWLLQELQDRGVQLPAAMPKRARTRQ